MIATEGTWDRKAAPIYFIASDTDFLVPASRMYPHLLCALNRLATEDDVADIRGCIARGCTVFLDSGVYDLAAAHAREHEMHISEVMGIEPEQIKGFTALFDKYVRVMRLMGAASWGYVEIDLGGRERKLAMRARLEAVGLRPIPVYHPLTDGWDYFDHLAQNYDRVCWANMSHATRPERVRLLATAFERRKKYPHLWLHVLGLTPSELMHVYPAHSCDSSAWLASLRWPDAHKEYVALQPFSRLPNTLAYRLESDADDPRGWHKALDVCTYQSVILQRNQRNMLADYAELTTGEML